MTDPISLAKAAMHIDKAKATVRARCALLGPQLHHVVDEQGERYVVGPRAFGTLDDVEVWLDSVNAP